MNLSDRQRENKKIKNKRSGFIKKLVGWILLVMGVIDLSSCLYTFTYSISWGIEEAIVPFIMAAVGAWMVWSAKKDVAKWDEYEALINQKGNTSISMLAEKTGKNPEKVRSEVQKMINNGFFNDENGNTGAYINGEYDMLVMMKNGQPLEPLEETARRQEAKAKKKAKAAESEVPSDPYADSIELAIAEIKDPDVVESLNRIEASIRKINNKISRNPELEETESVKQLRNIYLPKTMELVDKLRREDAGPEAMLEIKGILNTCAVAYDNIKEKVYKREDEDTLIDIEVLRETFEREGLLGSDFEL